MSKLAAENRTEDGTVFVVETTGLLTKLQRPVSAGARETVRSALSAGELSSNVPAADRRHCPVGVWLRRARAVVVRSDQISVSGEHRRTTVRVRNRDESQYFTWEPKRNIRRHGIFRLKRIRVNILERYYSARFRKRQRTVYTFYSFPKIQRKYVRFNDDRSINHGRFTISFGSNRSCFGNKIKKKKLGARVVRDTVFVFSTSQRKTVQVSGTIITAR